MAGGLFLHGRFGLLCFGQGRRLALLGALVAGLQLLVFPGRNTGREQADEDEQGSRAWRKVLMRA